MAVEKTVPLDAQDRDFLKSIPLLARLPGGVTSRLIEGHSPVVMERGTILCTQGQPAHFLHIIMRGWVKLYRIGDVGVEAVVGVAGPGDMVGDAGLLLPLGHPASAEAISPVRVFSIDANALNAIMHREPAVALGLAAALAQQVHDLTTHLEVMKLLDAQQRTAHFLLGLCPVETGAHSLTLPYEKAVIAGWLGMKPASFSRALFRLRRHGVTVDRDVVSITEVQRLAHLASAPGERDF